MVIPCTVALNSSAILLRIAGYSSVSTDSLATHGFWLATDADTKLVPCWHVGNRSGDAAMEFIDDLASRLTSRVQITTDDHKAYLDAIDTALGGEVDYAMLVKFFGAAPEAAKGRYSPAECTGIIKPPISGDPEDKHISTSYAERNNLNVRMH